jgi:hypothetical protein
MDKFRLTSEILDNALPDEIICDGFALDNLSGLNITGNNQRLRWVLKRMNGPKAWIIYVHFAHYDAHTVSKIGDTVYQKQNIQNILNVDDEMWDLYYEGLY